MVDILRIKRKKVLVFDHEEEMSDFMIKKWQEISKEAVGKKGYFAVALSGGRTPVPFYQRLAAANENFPWDQTHVFLVDERFVSPEDPKSNYRMLRNTLFEKIPLPRKNIHPIATEKISLELSAREYDMDLRKFFNVPEDFPPSFHLILLGMGEDGHTASLFPRSKALTEFLPFAICVNLDEVDPPRVTLTLPVINHSEHIIFFIRGMNKATVLKKIIHEEDSTLPASRVQPINGELLFLSDREASSKLSI